MALRAEDGEELWNVKTGKEVLYGLAIHEDYQDPRCHAETIHFMDEMIMMDKIFSDMFDDDDESMEDIISQEEAIREEDDDENIEPGKLRNFYHLRLRFLALNKILCLLFYFWRTY